MSSRISVILINLALSGGLLLGQRQGGQSAPPSTTPTNPSPGPGQAPGGIGTTQPGTQQPGTRNPFPGQQQQQFPEMQRSFFFSGKVIMEDGTPPPDPVQIERVCNGVPKPEAWTDSKGRFSFQLGQNNAILADASTSTSDGMFGSGSGMNRQMGLPGQPNITERDLVGCELRAMLPGFRSDVYSLAGRRSLDSPDIGTLVLRRLAKVEGFTFSATSAYAPRDARKAYEKGRDLVKKNKLDQAEKELEKATAAYPKYAVAWNELGIVYMSQKKVDEAQKAFQESIKADEKFISPYAQLTVIAAQSAKWDDAVQFSNKVIRLNPFYSPQIYFLNGVANLNLNKVNEAEESTREALKLDNGGKRNPRSMALLGVILAQKQDFKGAAENLKAYLKAAPNAPDAGQVRGQLESIERQMAGHGSKEAAPQPEQH